MSERNIIILMYLGKNSLHEENFQGMRMPRERISGGVHCLSDEEKNKTQNENKNTPTYILSRIKKGEFKLEY